MAVFVTLVWLLHHRASEIRSRTDLVHPVAVLAVLASTFSPAPVLATGIITAALVAATLVVSARGRSSVSRPTRA